jgi:hypothetical protein
MAKDMANDAYVSILRRIVDSGGVDPKDKQEIASLKLGLAMTNADVARIVRSQALDFYQFAFAAVIEDGIVTPREEQMLAWLHGETGLSAAEVEPFGVRLADVKRLGQIREGNLPSIQTRKILEGGELCHWESPCHFEYQTSARVVCVAGELLVTSKKFIFNSPTKNLSFSPWKIMEASVHRGTLFLQVDVRFGTGTYHVSRPTELEAVLVGLARRTKFQTNVSNGVATRHIEGHVKREVWARDRGQCVECGASGRGACLEFDHIIPHAKGGSNEANNIQLLCRPCNNLKSDRI